jgi:hypothetical protein
MTEHSNQSNVPLAPHSHTHIRTHARTHARMHVLIPVHPALEIVVLLRGLVDQQLRNGLLQLRHALKHCLKKNICAHKHTA